MNRFVRAFNLILGASAMVAVALLSAFITMGLAIHGREVEVPNLNGLTMAEANQALAARGLNLNLENRFYSTVMPAGRVLSQSPLPGTKVRREWQVRATASLGPQRVAIPDVVGQPERAAGVSIRHLSLDLGTVARLPAAGDQDIVLAQTPPANAAGVDRPRVSLIISAPEESAAQSGYVMPNLIGLPVSAASGRLAQLGIRIGTILGGAAEPAAAPVVPASPAPGSGDVAFSVPVAPVYAGTISSQSPMAGYRVSRGDNVRVTLGHPAGASAPTPASDH